ncbi:MAG: hypothetical protein JWR34_7397 [Mycobacterium sp.]|nr:hypothetical protein [Mycobacterium sp.]
MYLQSRTRRWLQSLRNTNTQLHSAVASVATYADAKKQGMKGVRVLSERDHEVMTCLARDAIDLALESQPLAPDSWLETTLRPVVEARQKFAYGAEFDHSLEVLINAIEAAMPLLDAHATEPDASINEIADELEQALLISLIVTLTSHNVLLATVSEWEPSHQRFLQGNLDEDPAHWFDVQTFKTTSEGGHGRVHMQRLASALDAGTSIWMAGAARETVDNYPESQSIAYAQWFTYAFALWEEQFRGRIAKYFDAEVDYKIRHSDVLIPYFGDIRLIRNDFVHNKGICKESADTQVLRFAFVKGQPLEITPHQMMFLVELFPHDELRTAPTPQPSGENVRVPGKVSPHLHEDVAKRARDLGISDNELLEQALDGWLTSNGD